MSKIKKQNLNLKNSKSVENLTTQIKELTNKWHRATADYQNLEKRVEKEREEWIKFGNSALLLKFLEVVDDLQRAARHLQDSGLDLVLEKLNNILKDIGVSKVEVKKFDPQTMECIGLVDGQKDQIVEVEQAGYFYHDRLLRPAKVKVGKGKLD